MKLVPRSESAFRAQPAGGYVAGRNWLYFCLDASLFGYMLWGVPLPGDLRGLVRLMELELDRPAHPALVDVSRVEGFGQPAFEVLAGYVTEHFEALGRVVTKISLVPPDGFNRAIASGFFAAVDAPFPVSYATDAARGLEQLGHPAPAEAGRALERAQTAAGGVPPHVRAVRLHIEAHLTTATLESAAKSMGASPRTLQRSLSEAETSFIEELQETRVRAAERLLQESDASMTEIALEVGCSSAQHFSSLFRKRRGQTPSAFRTARRSR